MERFIIPGVLFTVLALGACSAKADGDDSDEADADTDTDADSDADTDTDTDADTDTDTDTDTDSDSDSDADLQDVREGIVEDAEGCQDLGGTVTSGAKEYFWGEYRKSGASWSGQEAIYYFANDTWVSNGGADCVILWDMTATEIADAGACGDCELALAATATINESLTTCDYNMWRGDESFEGEYAVDLADNGTATWFFTGSGTEFGAGYWVDGGANYLSESSCVWF